MALSIKNDLSLRTLEENRLSVTKIDENLVLTQAISLASSNSLIYLSESFSVNSDTPLADPALKSFNSRTIPSFLYQPFENGCGFVFKFSNTDYGYLGSASSTNLWWSVLAGDISYKVLSISQINSATSSTSYPSYNNWDFNLTSLSFTNSTWTVTGTKIMGPTFSDFEPESIFVVGYKSMLSPTFSGGTGSIGGVVDGYTYFDYPTLQNRMYIGDLSYQIEIGVTGSVGSTGGTGSIVTVGGEGLLVNRIYLGDLTYPLLIGVTGSSFSGTGSIVTVGGEGLLVNKIYFGTASNEQYLYVSDGNLYLNGSTFSGGGSGSVGQTGTQGSVGSTGPQGLDGATGSQGLVGSTGPQGLVGSTGPQGSDGATGSQGLVGSTGPQGSDGATGSQGSNGATGPQGLDGATGSQGSNGATGSQGSNGATGPQGLDGATGSQGAAGPAGIDSQMRAFYSDDDIATGFYALSPTAVVAPEGPGAFSVQMYTSYTMSVGTTQSFYFSSLDSNGVDRYEFFHPIQSTNNGIIKNNLRLTAATYGFGITNDFRVDNIYYTGGLDAYWTVDTTTIAGTTSTVAGTLVAFGRTELSYTLTGTPPGGVVITTQSVPTYSAAPGVIGDFRIETVGLTASLYIHDGSQWWKFTNGISF